MAERATPGTFSHDGRPMTYAHGEYAGYKLDRCRCTECKNANSAYGRERALGVDVAYVGADPVRKHIAELAAAGVGLKQVAKVSGVSHGSLWKIVYGAPNRGPSKRVRKATADAVLAVTPRDAADGAKVPAGPTWKLIDEMIAAGVPKVRIAEAIGQAGPGLQLGRLCVSGRQARAVHGLHTMWRYGQITFVRHDRYGNEHEATPPPPPDPLEVARERAALRDELYGELADILEERIARTWRASAACADRPLHLFFPARGDHRAVAAARKICRACTVRAKCLEANLHQAEGIYGDTTPRQRRALRLAVEPREEATAP